MVSFFDNQLSSVNEKLKITLKPEYQEITNMHERFKFENREVQDLRFKT